MTKRIVFMLAVPITFMVIAPQEASAQYYGGGYGYQYPPCYYNYTCPIGFTHGIMLDSLRGGPRYGYGRPDGYSRYGRRGGIRLNIVLGRREPYYQPVVAPVQYREAEVAQPQQKDAEPKQPQAQEPERFQPRIDILNLTGYDVEVTVERNSQSEKYSLKSGKSLNIDPADRYQAVALVNGKRIVVDVVVHPEKARTLVLMAPAVQ